MLNPDVSSAVDTTVFFGNIYLRIEHTKQYLTTKVIAYCRFLAMLTLFTQTSPKAYPSVVVTPPSVTCHA